MSHHARTKKLEQEHRRRNPPKLRPPIRVLQDGETRERLSQPVGEPIPPNAFLVMREIVDPEPDPDDQRISAGEFRIVGRDGVVDPRSTMRDEPPAEEPAPHELADDEPEPRSKSKPRRKSAKERQREHSRELFEDRTQKWADQTGRKKAKTSRGIDHTPSERGELKQAVREDRVRIKKVEFFGRPKTRR